MRNTLLQVIPAASVSMMMSKDSTFLEILSQWRDMLDNDEREIYDCVDVVLKYLWFALYHRDPEVRDVIVSTLDRLLLKTINSE